MKRGVELKYPNSANLFQFCRKVLDHKFGGVRVIDQDVGQILGFDPADCSHWKKGKKNIRSIQAIKAISDHLGVDEHLVVDLATGDIDDAEAFIEYYGYGDFQIEDSIREAAKKEFYRKHASNWNKDRDQTLNEIFDLKEEAIAKIVENIHNTIDFQEAPLYLPEITSAFQDIQMAAVENLDLFEEKKPPVLCSLDGTKTKIQYLANTESRTYMRYHLSRALGQHFLQGKEFDLPKEFSTYQDIVRNVQCNLFAALLLTPEALVRNEMKNIDVSKDVVSQLAETFWVSKSFMNRRLQLMLQG